jgi:uncharacterized membrane protein YkvA (DUF1232 family)
MEWWQILIVAALVSVLVFGAIGFWLWRHASARSKSLFLRIQRLSWRSKVLLARRVFEDERVPLRTRLILPALVFYLAMPIDLVPDFVPVLGQIDDVVVLVAGVALLLRSTPLQVLEGHLAVLEGGPQAMPPSLP